MILAYPEFGEEGRDRLARAHYTDAIERQSVREGIFRARPKTLDEAIRAAMATENFEKMESQREVARKPNFCRVSEKNDDRIVGQIQMVVNAQLNEFNGLRNQYQSRTSEFPVQKAYMSSHYDDPICYNCGGRGHFAKNCPSPNIRSQKKFSGNEQRLNQRPEGKPYRQNWGQTGISEMQKQRG